MGQLDHSDIIHLIIESITSYAGNYFPKVARVDNVDETLPKFLVSPMRTPHLGDAIQYSEFFTVQVKASSQSELQTVMEAIQRCSSINASGYNSTTTITKTLVYYIENASDQISVYYQIADGIIDDSLDGLYSTNVFPSDEDSWATYLMFRATNQEIPQGAPISSATITLVAYNSKDHERSGDMDSYIFGFDEDEIVEVSEVTDNDDVTQTTAYVSNPDENTSGEWVAETVYNLSAGGSGTNLKNVVQEIVDRAGWTSGIGLFVRGWWTGAEGNYDCQFYAFDASNTNPTKIPKLTITIAGTLAANPTIGMPFYIHISPVGIENNENMWYATLEVEARWAL